MAEKKNNATKSDVAMTQAKTKDSESRKKTFR